MRFWLTYLERCVRTSSRFCPVIGLQSSFRLTILPRGESHTGTVASRSVPVSSQLNLSNGKVVEVGYVKDSVSSVNGKPLRRTERSLAARTILQLEAPA